MKVSLLKRIMSLTFVIPHQYGFIPSDQERFVAEKKYRKTKWVIKFIKRYFFKKVLLDLMTRGNELEGINAEHKKILWINLSAPSLGDSLMDLSPRILLQNRDLVLFTDKKNIALYEKDEFFNQVCCDPHELISMVGEKNKFDLVICDSFSPKVVLKKFLLARNTPYVSLYRFINGFDVDRTLFSFYRMSELLSFEKSKLNAIQVRPYLSLPIEDGLEIDTDFAIAIGGEWDYRTYDKWPNVIRHLLSKGYSCKLVGSRNGEDMARKLEGLFPQVKNLVGKLDLLETILQINLCKYFIGADGGLWHCAASLSKPSVVLFADLRLKDALGRQCVRVTKDTKCEYVYDDHSVSNIKTDSVINAIEKLVVAH